MASYDEKIIGSILVSDGETGFQKVKIRDGNDKLINFLNNSLEVNENYSSFEDLWSTADFKDGGVSASVCTPYMWSLYEYIWEYTLRKFILDSKILKPLELPTKLGDMFYGRCYWNMSAVKKAMSQVVGYKEREFDSEYGIQGNYEGNGNETKLTLKTTYHIIYLSIFLHLKLIIHLS